MKKIALFLSVLAFGACTGDDGTEVVNLDPIEGNKVFMLKVDYQSNQFEGATEFSFDEPTDTFTISQEYTPPGDFGNLKLYYDELGFKLFDGDIVWMGVGSLNFPQGFDAPESFAHVPTDDLVFPANGFETVFQFSPAQQVNHEAAWNQIQNLVKVRQYLQTNPQATVKVFLYTPSVGVGNPADWDWFFILKN